MKRFIVLGALALCLLSGTAMADKARNIASDADSRYHAAHLENHLDTTDVYCTGNYVDCYCDAGEYAGEGEANGFVYADENCRNYDEVIELYIRAIKERWDSDKISEFGFEPYCFVSSMESDGYLLKDLNGDGNDELIILPRSCLEYRDAEERGILYAVYTMKDGKPIRVLYSWTRRRNYLCTDGEIYSEGSDGAAYFTACIYDIRDGKAVVREGVQTTDRMDENGEYLEGTVYLRMTESHDFYDGEEISEEQADADLERYQKMLLTDDRNFVSFAEYEKKSR